jgi:hypothetical protein
MCYLKRQLRWLVTGLSCWVLRFNHMAVRMLVHGEQSDIRAGVSPRTSAFLSHIVPPKLRTHLHLNAALLRRTIGRSLGAFQQSSAFFSNMRET